MLKLDIKIKGLDHLIRNFKNPIDDINNALQLAINRSALILTQIAKAEAPQKTGALRRSIRPELGNLQAVIRPNIDYALFVHEGTKAHTITPKNKQALFWQGALHPVKSVRHPGTKPNRFMIRTEERGMSHVRTIFQKEVGNLMTVLVRK